MRPSVTCALRRFNSAYLFSAAAAVMLTACSSSSERFAENPSDSDPVYTASVPKEQVAEAAPDEAVTSRPLAKAKPGNSNYASNATNYQASYRQPSYKNYEPLPEPAQVTAAKPETPAYEPVNDQPASNYKPPTMAAKGGTVEVAPGMTLYSIAKANGVTVSEIAAANGITPPYSVRTGQTLRIPGVAQARAPEPAAQAKQMAEASAAKPVASKETHTVKSGETLFSLGRAYGVHPYAIADLNGLQHTTTLRLGQTVKIPGNGGAVVAKAKTTPAPVKEQVVVQTTPASAKPKKPDGPEERLPQAAEAAPAPVAAPAAQQIAEAPPVVTPDPSLPGFRWPVKGKVISAYGAKPGGLRNEGINIAVPEGSSVRSAESGVIAYAGNELKGYGNLVLIRHSGGWVTAYAHNKELFVKRGDTVKRGDVIAKAGQTGSVTSPQVHFEVRKGATAMDPMRFLGSSTASN